MGSFIDDFWESLWTGWTPIVTLLFFLLGLKLSSWMSEFFTTGLVWFITRFLVPFIIAACVPFFSMNSKRKR